MEGRFIAVVIIVTVGKMIMLELLEGMNEEVAAVVVIIIIMMTANTDHLIVETKDAGIIMMMIDIIRIEEIMTEGEEVVATVDDAAVQGEAEVDPCQGAAVDHILAHVM